MAANNSSEAQKRARKKYIATKTDDIRLRVPRGTKDKWKAAAAKRDISMTKFVVWCVNQQIQ